jgi:hypothetical protein
MLPFLPRFGQAENTISCCSLYSPPATPRIVEIIVRKVLPRVFRIKHFNGEVKTVFGQANTHFATDSASHVHLPSGSAGRQAPRVGQHVAPHTGSSHTVATPLARRHQQPHPVREQLLLSDATMYWNPWPSRPTGIGLGSYHFNVVKYSLHTLQSLLKLPTPSHMAIGPTIPPTHPTPMANLSKRSMPPQCSARHNHHAGVKSFIQDRWIVRGDSDANVDACIILVGGASHGSRWRCRSA